MKRLIMIVVAITSITTSVLAQGNYDQLGVQMDAIGRMNQAIKDGTYGVPAQPQAQLPSAPLVAAPSESDCEATCANYCGRRGYTRCVPSSDRCEWNCR